MASIKCDISNIYQLIEKLRVNVSDFYSLHTNQIYSLQNNNILNTNQFNEIKETVSLLEDELTKIKSSVEFISTIESIQEPFNQTSFETFTGDLDFSDNNDFDYSNDSFQKLSYFIKHNEPSVFINLVISVVFQSFVTVNADINFQGANSEVTYFAVNTPSISTIYKNIPYLTFPSTNYWKLLVIDTDADWVDQVNFFSFTPYIGRYRKEGETIDYLANCNISITSTLINANSPGIFKRKGEKVYILYTFNKVFASIFENPTENKYAITLPDMIDTSDFTIIARFEKEFSMNTVNFTNTIRQYTFSEYPYHFPSVSSNLEVDIETENSLSRKLNKFPVISSNYKKNDKNIDNFIETIKTFAQDESYEALSIYPYFYLSNNNAVVTNVYQLIESDSTCNALINDFNKNYYNSEKIKIRNDDGSLLFSKFVILAINHTLSGYATSCNIQVYNVDTQKSIQTYRTSSLLPVLSDKDSPSDSYSVKQDEEVYQIEIDTTESWLEDIHEIAFFERINYPVAFLDNDEYISSGPRYSTFTFDENATEANPSENCTEESVLENNIYNITSNDPNFSLHLNYCKYSTLNFRVFALPV